MNELDPEVKIALAKLAQAQHDYAFATRCEMRARSHARNGNVVNFWRKCDSSAHSRAVSAHNCLRKCTGFRPFSNGLGSLSSFWSWISWFRVASLAPSPMTRSAANEKAEGAFAGEEIDRLEVESFKAEKDVEIAQANVEIAVRNEKS